MTDWRSTHPLVLGAFTLDPAPSPRNHHPLIDIRLGLGYTLNDSCFHPLLFLYPYLQEIASLFE